MRDYLKQREILARIAVERARQGNRDPWPWLAVLAGDANRLAKRVTDGQLDEQQAGEYRRELIQAAAAIVAAVEALDRGPHPADERPRARIRPLIV